MVKRKRNEPTLAENLESWEKALVKALKTAKGFERQRYAKRQKGADAEKSVRLEREIAVLKSIDLYQAAHQHLCSSLLRIKAIAASPKLPETIKPLPKPELTEEQRVALHNVTSALCNRKQVKDVIDEAIVGTCMALRVPMPEKKGKGKAKNDRQDQEQQADDIEKKTSKSKAEKKSATLSSASDGHESDDESWAGVGSDAEDDSKDAAGSDEEEKALARFDALLGSSSEDEDEGDDEAEDSRARSIRGPSDYFSGSSDVEGSEADGAELSEEEEDEEDEDDAGSSSSAISPPPKRAKAKGAKVEAVTSGSTFLPSLMGGYISGSESEASDVDVAPALKKNRRGQRARQAIWEKKFKQAANHLKKQNEKAFRDQGWDMKKGAVGEEDSGPWKKGIRNPFEKPAVQEGVHPDRQANFNGGDARPAQKAPPKPKFQPRDGPQNSRAERPPSGFQGRRPEFSQRDQPPPSAAPKPKPKPKKDDEGPLHASWEAAKKAKEATQKATFQGKKITFD